MRCLAPGSWAVSPRYPAHTDNHAGPRHRRRGDERAATYDTEATRPRGGRSHLVVVLLTTALAVVVGCSTDSTLAVPDAAASSTVTATTFIVTASTTASTSASVEVALLAVQGDVKRVVGKDLLPTKCAVRYASDGRALPDRGCTPGVIATRVTQANIRSTICTPNYTSSVRPPTSETNPLKYAAERAYGLDDDPRIEYDHLIALELGGANDVRNLWPEPPTSPAQKSTANAKDDVENELHDQVCAGHMTLADAQQRIATDWTTALE